MAQLYNTNLIVVASPLPADFEGDPQDFFDAIIERLEIQSPVGTQFFVVGDVEPTTNQGPWLKNGNKWYVFDTTTGGYVPLDITDSSKTLFVVSATTPAGPVNATDPTVWLRTIASRVIGWYFWDGSIWRPGGNVPPSGPTTARPTSPVDYEQFFDTTISVLLHFERGAWRTIAGSPGDVKFVTTATLGAALLANPGWLYVAESNQSWRGATLAIASKDTGTSPATSYSVNAGITQRAPGETAGEETHVLTSTEIEQHTHLVGALTLLNSDNNVQFYRVDNGDNLTAPAPKVAPNYALILGSGGGNGTKTGVFPATGAGTMFVTTTQLSLSGNASYTSAAVAHQNLQPTVYMWALTKQ